MIQIYPFHGNGGNLSADLAHEELNISHETILQTRLFVQYEKYAGLQPEGICIRTVVLTGSCTVEEVNRS